MDESNARSPRVFWSHERPVPGSRPDLWLLILGIGSPWQAIVFADLKATQALWVYTMVELAWGVATSVLKENATRQAVCFVTLIW